MDRQLQHSSQCLIAGVRWLDLPPPPPPPPPPFFFALSPGPFEEPTVIAPEFLFGRPEQQPN